MDGVLTGFMTTRPKLKRRESKGPTITERGHGGKVELALGIFSILVIVSLMGRFTTLRMLNFKVRDVGGEACF